MRHRWRSEAGRNAPASQTKSLRDCHEGSRRALLVWNVSVNARAQNLSKPDSSKQTKQSDQPSAPNGYVGSEVCKTCHEDMPTKGFFKAFEDSPHFVVSGELIQRQ